MLLLHSLDILVIFLLNVEYIFLHFFRTSNYHTSSAATSFISINNSHLHSPSFTLQVHLLFTSSSFLDDVRDVVADHSSKNFSYKADTPHCLVCTFQMVNIIHRHYWSFNFTFIDLLFLCHLHWSSKPPLQHRLLHLTGFSTRRM